jgi:hypothetical protein
MDIDALLGAGSGGVLGGIAAKVISYFDKRDLDEKFEKIGNEMQTLERSAVRHQAQIEAQEKAQTAIVRDMGTINGKLDVLLSHVSKIQGSLDK